MSTSGGERHGPTDGLEMMGEGNAGVHDSYIERTFGTMKIDAHSIKLPLRIQSVRVFHKGHQSNFH